MRFVTLSTSGHRATLGMMSMHLLGFRFASTFQGNLGAWGAEP
jgi:hypothetical protein